MNLQPFRLERYFALYEFDVPYLLSSSDCESLTIAELLDKHEMDAFHRLHLGYTPSEGSPSLREAVTTLYRDMTPGDIIVHAGAQEAVFTTLYAVLSPSDHAIIHAPCYQSLLEIPRTVGCEVTEWKATPDNGWKLELDDLKRLIKPTTRLVVINCPHNPTGYTMDAAQWTELARLAGERGFFVLSDEVYRFSEYDDAHRLPAMADLTPFGISLGVMSKSFGLAGLRIGWIACRSADVRKRVQEIKDYTTICSSAPSEFLATVALSKKDRLIDRNRAVIASNLERADGFFERHREKFDWRRPQAGPVAFPSFRDSVDVAKLAKRLAQNQGVMILPGFVYGDEWSAHFRLGLGRRNFPEALSAFENGIS
jgi:aspartate/methionine/tyrosine aminotransferase